MRPALDLYIGAPIENGAELDCLNALADRLERSGLDAVVLANFFTKKSVRQIDFVVVTDHHAHLVECKHFTGPVFGCLNGPWQLEDASGRRVPYPGENPFHQTADTKMALSDDLHAFSRADGEVPPPRENKFFRQFEASVCILPGLAAGSKVTSGNFRAWVRSFDNLVQHIIERPIASSWGRAEWRALAERFYGLEKVDLAAASVGELRSARRVVVAYREHFGTFNGHTAGALVEAKTEGTNPSVLYGRSLIEALLDGSHHLLTGPSGSGKSTHLRHAAGEAVRQGLLPLFVEGKHYEGNFNRWLHKSIAHCCTEGAGRLLDAAATSGERPVLLVDGFDACPTNLRPTLIKDLQAFFLRHACPIVVSSQFNPGLPPDLFGTALEITPPSPALRRQLFAHYAGVEADERADVLAEPFDNAFDIMLAGQCCGALKEEVTRAALVDTFVRQLPWSVSATAAREILRTTATVLAQRFAATMPLAEFERLGEETLRRAGAPLTVLDEVRDCRLVDCSLGRFSFSHELFANFFRADALRRDCCDRDTLTGALTRPACRTLVEFVLPALRQTEELRPVLSQLADPAVNVACLNGRHGTLARQVVQAEAHRVLAAAAEKVPEFEDVELSDAGGDDLPEVPLISRFAVWEPSAFDVSLMDALGQHMADPQFTAPYLELLEGTEDAMRRAIVNWASERGKRPLQLWTAVFAQAFLSFGSRVVCPAGRIFNAWWQSPQSWARSSRSEGSILPELRARLADPGNNPRTLVLAMCCRELSRGETLDADLIADVFSRSWESRVWNLRLEALQMMQFIAEAAQRCLAAEGLSRLKALLEPLPGSNPILNSAIFEAMIPYGMVEPPVTLERALEEFQEVLTGGDDFGAERACGLIGSMFEDIYQGVYWEAYEALDEDDQVRTLRLAASIPEPGFWTAWMLEELINRGDEECLPIFRRFAGELPAVNEPFLQDAIQRHLLGIEGCALFQDEPPVLLEPPTDDGTTEAWATFDQIVFWTAKHRADSEKRRRACAPLWECVLTELQLASVDVLFQIGQAMAMTATLKRQDGVSLAAVFPAEVKRLCEHGLVNMAKLKSSFGHTKVWTLPDGWPRFIINTLGTIGDEGSAKLLENFAEDPKLGELACANIRRLRKNLVC